MTGGVVGLRVGERLESGDARVWKGHDPFASPFTADSKKPSIAIHLGPLKAAGFADAQSTPIEEQNEGEISFGVSSLGFCQSAFSLGPERLQERQCFVDG